MRDYEPYYTEDGSIGLYSYADKDVYHSKFGALTEAWEKFVLPANIDLNIKNELKVLDVCYGIGYNTKALISFLIKNLKFEKKNIFQKLINIVSKDANKTSNKERDLLPYVDTIDDNKKYSFQIDCLDINNELAKLSPFFKTIKTPGEIYDDLIPNVLTCFDSYYKARRVFENCASIFYPKNRQEIQELLDLKFKNMHIDKSYKIHPYTNYLLINALYEKYGKQYLDKDLKKNLTLRQNRRFYDKSLIKYAKFNHFWGYNKSSKNVLSAFLHNIYYSHLSKRDKNIDFKTVEKLFKLNFYINDARKTILEIEEQYDLIFLDAFTYTKSPQLWTIEFISELYNRLSGDGFLLTYSTSAQVRNTLLECNFFVGKIYNKKTNKIIGTIAAKNKNLIEFPLSNYELGLCSTKAGIPYRDKTLSMEAKEIIELREFEFRHSSLMSSSKYMKIRGNKDE